MQIKPNFINHPNQPDVVGARLPAQGKPEFTPREEETVALSEQGNWLASVKAAANSTPPIRQDIVEQTRAELKSGSLNKLYSGSAVDALLSELSA